MAKAHLSGFPCQRIPGWILLFVLWVAPFAHGQIFVLNEGSGTIGEYDRDGKPVNPALISGIAAFSLGLSASSLFTGDTGTGTVTQYNLSGETVNKSVISNVTPTCIATSGSDLYVADARTGTIGKYTSDGTVVNARLITGVQGVLGIAVSGSNLYVIDRVKGAISQYTTSGQVVNPTLISGQRGVFGLAATGDSLYLVNIVKGAVMEYTTAGELVNPNLIPDLKGPMGIAASKGLLYVTSNHQIQADGTVSVYTTDGKLVNSALISGLHNPSRIAMFDNGAAPTPVSRPGDNDRANDYPKVVMASGKPVPVPPRFNLPPVIVDSFNYGTENNWLAHHIALRIVTFCYLILHPGAQSAPDFKITAEVNASTHAVRLKIENFSDAPVTATLRPAFAWDPAGYAPLVTQLLGNAPPSADGKSDGPLDLLTCLLKLTGPNLAQQDTHLSVFLRTQPAWAEGHEQAALLLTALALRDRAGIYTDCRQILCRATAHLALARALRKNEPASWSGDVADAALRTLSGRETDALTHLDTLAARANPPASLQPWLTALRARTTGDWRQLKLDQSASLLTKIVAAHVMADELSSVGAAKRLGASGNLEKIPDWGRCALNNNIHFSVEIGDIYGEETPVLELQELNDILKLERPPLTLDVRNLKDFFSRPLQEKVLTGDPAVLQVIGPDLFCDVTRRHLLAETNAAAYWIRVLLGSSDGLKSYRDSSAGILSNLRLWNTLTWPGETVDYTKILARLGEEHLTWEPWELAMGEFPGNDRLIYPDVHTLHAFYADGLPFGTAYDLYHRKVSLVDSQLLGLDQHPDYLVQGVSLEQAEALRQLAPSSFTAMILGPLPPDIAKRTEPLWDYSLEPILWLQNSFPGSIQGNAPLATQAHGFYDNPQPSAPTAPTYDQLQQKHLALDPDTYFELGSELRAQGKLDAAAEADRKGFDEGDDQVGMSNAVGPLVDYYYDHGRLDEAEMVAKQAAEVESEEGMAIYALLLEKLGRLDEAQRYGQMVQDHYHSSEVFDQLYIRHADRFPQQYATLVKKLFPGGLLKVDLATLKPGPPTNGCQFKNQNGPLIKATLQADDIVVALNSYKVENIDQYAFIRAMSLDPGMDFIVWRYDRYLPIHASVPGRIFGVDMETIQPH